MNSNGLDELGEPIQHVMDNTKRKPITRLLTNLGSNGGWKNSKASTWSRNFH